MKLLQTSRSLPIVKKTKQSDTVIPASPKQPSSQLSNEAETMLNDLQSSLAQFLHNNSTITCHRTAMIDEEQNRKSLPMIRSIGNMNSGNSPTEIESSSMRVEWLDDAMRAERKKMNDEDEFNVHSQQSRSSQLNIGQKRPLVDSNFDQSFNTKKCRI